MRFSNKDALEVGKAAEHIVCADLILSGYVAFLSDQGLPYDVLIEKDGRILRVQVRSTLKAINVSSKSRAPSFRYNFSVRRRGKKGSKRLGDDDCDIVALVAIDTREIAYLTVFECGQTVQLRPSDADIPEGRYVRKRYSKMNEFDISRAISLFESGPGESREIDTFFREATYYEYKGERKRLHELATEHGLKSGTVSRRLSLGWSLSDALNTKVRSASVRPSGIIDMFENGYEAE